MGSRDFREPIERSLDKLHDDLKPKSDPANAGKIHAEEASTCMRLAYYERRDPLRVEGTRKTLALLNNGFRHSLPNLRAEYQVDSSLALDVNADMIIDNEYVVRFELVPTLPEVPNPRHMLYINACLFAFKKTEGFLIYFDAQGRSIEFLVTKSNRMFEEIVRRARVLSTLLKDGKTPIVEPSELCQGCSYYERCYAVMEKEEKGQDLIAELFGKGKKK